MKNVLIIKNADFSNVKIDEEVFGNVVPMERGTINATGSPIAVDNSVIRSQELIYVGAHKTIVIYSTNNSTVAVNWYATSEYANRTGAESNWSPTPHQISTGSYDYINILSKKSSDKEQYEDFSPDETVIYWKFAE